MDRKNRIGVIGYGEAGQAFTKGWRVDQPNLDVHVFDRKTETAEAGAKRAEYKRDGVRGFDRVADLESDVLFSLVTADQAQYAAQAAAESLNGGVLFFDGNSCAPQTKVGSAQRIESAGGRYVDMAIMSPVHPKLHKSPVLISGSHTQEAAQLLQSLHMDVQIVPGEVGAASSVKMVRSIMMKGLEAVMMECVLAGRAAGVDARVLDSLDVTYPGFDWRKQAARMMERATTHGVRRAAEMREVAKTVDDLGLPSTMATATVDWMEKAAASGVRGHGGTPAYGDMGGRLLAALRGETR